MRDCFPALAVTASVRIVELPGLPEKGDVSDWLNVGGTPEQLRELLGAAPLFDPTTVHIEEPKPREQFLFLSNADLDDEGELTVKRNMRDILADVDRLTNNSVRRVGSSLFVPSPDGISWLMSPEALTGYLGSVTSGPPVFMRSGHSRGEVFAELQRTTTAHVAVETLIHEPPMAGHYYAFDPPRDRQRRLPAVAAESLFAGDGDRPRSDHGGDDDGDLGWARRNPAGVRVHC
ncbi:MAG: hypothetical protein U0872_02665 [Planctomycetaceae bacterium]